MPDGITHDPLTGGPPVPEGHTRVCHAGALGAASRAVREEWNPQGRYYGPEGPSDEAWAEVVRRAGEAMRNGTHCICQTKHPRKSRPRRR